MTVGDGDIIRGVLSLTMVNGDVAKNVFTWVVDKISIGTWSDAVVANLINDAMFLIFDEIEEHIDQVVSFDTVDLYKWVAPYWDYLATAASAIVSSGVGEVTPPGVAALMTAYTALNRVFGRKFIYGFMEASLDDGALGAAALASIADAALEYITPYSAGVMGPLDFLVPGVYSSVTSGFVPFSDVAIVKDTISYQRRRKTGVGV